MTTAHTLIVQLALIQECLHRLDNLIADATTSLETVVNSPSISDTDPALYDASSLSISQTDLGNSSSVSGSSLSALSITSVRSGTDPLAFHQFVDGMAFVLTRLGVHKISPRAWTSPSNQEFPSIAEISKAYAGLLSIHSNDKWYVCFRGIEVGVSPYLSDININTSGVSNNCHAAYSSFVEAVTMFAKAITDDTVARFGGHPAPIAIDTSKGDPPSIAKVVENIDDLPEILPDGRKYAVVTRGKTPGIFEYGLYGSMNVSGQSAGCIASYSTTAVALNAYDHAYRLGHVAHLL